MRREREREIGLSREERNKSGEKCAIKMESNKTKSVFDSYVKQIKTKLNAKRVRHENDWMLFEDFGDTQSLCAIKDLYVFLLMYIMYLCSS